MNESPSPVSRRNFLNVSALTASGLLALLPGQAETNNANRIDVHHHFVPDEYFDYQRRHNPAATNAWSLSKDLEDMDRFGTATAMLSITQPGVQSWRWRRDSTCRARVQ